MRFQIIQTIASKYMPMLISSAGMTMFIALTGTLIGLVIGLIIGVIRTIPQIKSGARNIALKVVNAILSFYVEFFRGTPMIVQSMVIYYGSLLFFGIEMDRTFAAVFIVSINTGAYMAEIVRGGIVSIDPGQFEAAQAIGMTHWQTMSNVIIPQVVRNILPATGNEFVINIKDTSVLNVIGVTELFFQTKTISGATFNYFETYFIACIIYFVLTFTITRLLRLLERKMDGPASYQLVDEAARR